MNIYVLVNLEDNAQSNQNLLTAKVHYFYTIFTYMN